MLTPAKATLAMLLILLELFVVFWWKLGLWEMKRKPSETNWESQYDGLIIVCLRKEVKGNFVMESQIRDIDNI